MGSIREYKRKCKQAGCNVEFIVSAPSMDEDRMIGFSEPEYCPKHRMLHAKSYSRIACHHFDIEETEAGTRLIQQMEEAKARGEKLSLGPGGIGQFDRPLRPFKTSASTNPVKREFPIAEKDEEILQALEHNQVIVLVGPTGSGKSTHVPHMLLRSKWSRRGPVVVTQPRIQATRQIPHFVARLNNSSYGPGAEIGYCHSNADEYDRRTRLLFMTDGKLINDIVSGMVSNYSVVIIDEAHERSVNIDLILGLLKDQLYLYPHLRVIIASATIDHESFINYFGSEERVPFVRSKGRFFGITEHWWGGPEEDWWQHVNDGVQSERDLLPEAIADLTQYLCKKLDGLSPAEKKEKDGHILVFLPGTREIDCTVSTIRARNLPNVLALPLYARRPLDEQDRALDPKDPKDQKMRRVVVSTNVAETSLTVEGVKFVIDSGYIKESYWNPKTEVTELRTVRHSKAGCRQRWGRAGRIAPGDAYMLYTRQQFEETFPDHTSPDIARSSLEQVILTALAAGVRDVFKFAWMPLAREEDQERFQEELRRAFDALKHKGAVDKDGDLTSFGLELRGVPTALDIATVFAKGDQQAMGVEVATLLPFLKLDFGLGSVLLWRREREPEDQKWDTYKKLKVRHHHLALVYGCRDDLDLFLKLWMVWESLSSKGKRRKWCEEAGIDYKTFEEKIEEERRKLLGSVMDWRKAEKRPINVEKIDALRALIAHCLSNEIYVPMESDEQQFDELSHLDWESYWDGTDHYEEYEDDFDIDPTLSTPLGDETRSGVFRRRNQSSREVSEDSLVEIAPMSVCYNQSDLDLFVACQRRTNFLRPARAKSLGLNLVRLEKDWLRVLNASRVERTMFYASLSRWRDPAEHSQRKVRLFLPWLVPLGSEVRGTIQAWTTDRGGTVALTVTPSKSPLVGDLGNGPLSIQGWMAVDEIDPSDADVFAEGAEVTARVVGYGEGESGDPLLLLSHCRSQAHAFADFARRYCKHKGKAIEVEMHRVLKDPLGRRPLFIVREPESGLDIPMSASDFCGDTHFRPYFGLRFEVGERFQVDIEDILEDYKEVYLSRIRYLLDEYDGVPKDWDRNIKSVEVLRVDKLGVYLAIKGRGAPYVSFVRRALWPYDFNPRPGDRVRARLRRYERNINVQKLRERLEEGDALPQELDLGIELDLRIPPAYDRFKERYPEGRLLTVSIDRQLDNGGLLLDLGDGLKAIVYASELGLGEDGNLKSARDYTPGDRIDVRVVRLRDETASIQCSIFRVASLPTDLEKGNVVDARVLMMRSDRKQPDLKYITCSLDDKYRVDVRGEMPDLSIDVGDVVHVRITGKYDQTAYIGGELVDVE